MKFSTNDVRVMNRLYRNGVKIKTIANSFGCDQSSVGYHVNGVTKNRKRGRYLKNKLSALGDIDAYNFANAYCGHNLAMDVIESYFYD